MSGVDLFAEVQRGLQIERFLFKLLRILLGV